MPRQVPFPNNIYHNCGPPCYDWMYIYTNIKNIALPRIVVQYSIETNTRVVSTYFNESLYHKTASTHLSSERLFGPVSREGTRICQAKLSFIEGNTEISSCTTVTTVKPMPIVRHWFIQKGFSFTGHYVDATGIGRRISTVYCAYSRPTLCAKS